MMSLPSNSLPKFEAYYDAATRQYWIRNSRGGWIEVRESSLRRHLRAMGYRNNPMEGERISPIETQLNMIQTEKDVVYAGPLAGYKSGLHEIMNQRVLVTASPVFIKPAPGDWPVLRQLLGNLFNEKPELRQLDVVFGWLKVGVEALYSGKFRPGQALVIAGEAGCGKSLVQQVFTELFGGRYAKPFQYMMGGTTFNGDLFGAEHLMLEDETSTTDIRARRNFGTRIKDITVNSMQRLHAKHQNAIPMRPFWRLSITLNDEPENLMVLPPIDDSLEDKLILLRARKLPMPMPTTTMEQRDAFWNTLVAELPAFVHFLQQWEITGDLQCERYGVRHVHHPDLLAALNELSPESRLLMLIDHIVFSDANRREPWEGPATELESVLGENIKYGREVKGLLQWAQACAAYLGRLAKKQPERVVYKRSGGFRRWVIYPPSRDSPPEQGEMPI